MSRGSNGSSIPGPGNNRRRGGHSGQRSRSVREEGNRRCKGGIPQIEREHRITLAARKGTAPPTTVTSAIRSAATAGATTTTTATREGDEHHYLLDTEAGGGGNAADLCFLPSCLPPQNSSRRNQYKITKSTVKKDFCISGRDFCTYGATNPSRGAKISIVW